MVKPFFNNGLSVASGNADKRAGEQLPVMGGKFLQGSESIINPYKSGPGEGLNKILSFGNNKSTDTAFKKIGNEIMTVVGLALQRKK